MNVVSKVMIADEVPWPEQCWVSRNELVSALRRLVMIIDRHSVAPILDQVILQKISGRLVLMTTNLDVWGKTSIPCSIHGGPLHCATNARVLLRAVQHLPADQGIGFRKDGDRLRVDGGTFQARLFTMPVDDFPGVPELKSPVRFEIATEVLRSLLGRVRFAISGEQTRYYLNGISLSVTEDRLFAVATDGHRLAAISTALPDGATGMPAIIIPKGILNPLAASFGKLGDPIDVEVADSRLKVTVGGFVITGKMIDGQFPDWRRVIPELGSMAMTVKRPEFVTSLARVSSVTARDRERIRIAAGEGALELKGDDRERGEAVERLPTASFDNGPFTLEIGFQTRYLREIAAQIGGDMQFVFVGEGQPVRITDTADPHALFILMPMRF